MPWVPPYQTMSGSKFSFTVGTFAFFVSAFSSEPSPSESSSASCIVAVFAFFFFEICFGVFFGNYLIIFIVGDGDGSVPIGMSALIDLTETS